MLCVPHSIQASEIAGIGVFAAAPIKAGALIWDFLPGFDLALDIETIMTLPPAVQEYIAKYGHVDDTRSGRIGICSGHGKFVNHSDNPNMSDQGTGCIATRDIAAGEELVGDYAQWGAGCYDYETWRLDLSKFADLHHERSFK